VKPCTAAISLFPRVKCQDRAKEAVRRILAARDIYARLDMPDSEAEWRVELAWALYELERDDEALIKYTRASRLAPIIHGGVVVGGLGSAKTPFW